MLNMGFGANYGNMSDKFVIICVGHAASNILGKFSSLKNNEIVAVVINFNHEGMRYADVGLYLDWSLSDNEFVFSIPTKRYEKDFKKVIDFIKLNLNKNQKVIAVGHGCGSSKEIYCHVLCELKNNGHSFKAIMPTPFSFEGKRRHWHQETFEFLKNKGIDVNTFDYDQIIQEHENMTFEEAFRLCDEMLFEKVVNTIENWQK